MSSLMTMPRMGETMESGRIVAWLKQPGDAFKRGEVIVEIETDKTTVEMPALDDGRLVEILAREGAEVAVGDALGRYDAATASASAAPPVQAAMPLNLPRMGETMEEGRIVAWLKQPGDAFKRGEVIVEIETDKTTVEMPALDDGRLVDILAEAGATVGVGEPIGHYVPAGAGPSASVPAKTALPEPPPPSGRSDAAPSPPRAAAPTTGRVRATPLARRLARIGGLDLATVSGSGRRARVEKRDVEALLIKTPAIPSGASAMMSTPELRFVDLPQGSMAYREWVPPTVRDTMLFLHGFSADGATWSSFAAALVRQGTRIVAPDLPGHGATAIEAESIDGMVDAVVAFAKALRLEKADLVAHSMGAALAVMAVSKGIAPAGLTLIAPAGLGAEIDADFVNGLADLRSAGALAHLLRRLARRVPPLSRPQLDRMAAEFARGRLKALAHALVEGGRQAVDIVPDLAALSRPTRILWGTEDRIIPWTQVANGPSRIPIHLIAGAGHMPHWDAPQEFAALFT